VNEYRKLFDANSHTDLKTLKTTYRNLIKEWHPDKFQHDAELAAEADLKSQQIIDAYHFLVSIAPETRESNLEEYNQTLNESAIVDFKHKGMLMEVTFLNGNTYEYFGVNQALFQKFVNSDKQMRFGKRSIFTSVLYRKVRKSAVEA